jgi:tetratricopeptide (TPR) repeat protein
MLLGESYEKQGEFVKAAATYEQAVKLNPKLLSATAKLAQLNAGPLQASDKGLEFARKARELAPNDPKVIGILGGAAYQTGNFAWAYGLLQESARRLPNDAEILHDLAWAAYGLGKVSEARQTMQRVLAAAPDSGQSSDAKLFLAMTALDQEGTGLVAAESEIEKALKANPNYVPALMAQAGSSSTRRIKDRSHHLHQVLRRLLISLPRKSAWRRCAQIPEKRDEAYTWPQGVELSRTIPNSPRSSPN